MSNPKKEVKKTKEEAKKKQEDVTLYDEFIPSFDAWLPPRVQAERSKHLEERVEE